MTTKTEAEKIEALEKRVIQLEFYLLALFTLTGDIGRPGIETAINNAGQEFCGRVTKNGALDEFMLAELAIWAEG